MIEWARSANGFAVLDTADGLSVPDAIDYSTSLTSSSYAAVYYPNYYITDPLSRSRGRLRKVGPAGAAVGLYMNTDKVSGPFRAPAGTSTKVQTAVSLERAFTPSDLDSLNTGQYEGEGIVYGSPVNAVRNVPGAGIVVMGARTLLQDGTANRYVNTRR